MGLGFGRAGVGMKGLWLNVETTFRERSMEAMMLGTTAWRSQKVEVGIVLGLHASLELLMDGFDSGLLGWLGNHPIGHEVASEPPLTIDFILYYFSFFPSKRRRFGGHFLNDFSLKGYFNHLPSPKQRSFDVSIHFDSNN
jgi:hypothetical protein